MLNCLIVCLKEGKTHIQLKPNMSENITYLPLLSW